jgi:hypothetical protein
MVDFIEVTVSRTTAGLQPVMVRKSNVVAILREEDGTPTLFLNSGDMFHVKQSYDEIKEQFKFE